MRTMEAVRERMNTTAKIAIVTFGEDELPI
jgi:hypothetical protein